MKDKLQDVPLDDLIAEIRARLKVDEAVWPALLAVVQDHVVEVVPRPSDATTWPDE